MCMEIALINRQDVAEPDPASSGVAGTGQKNGKNTGIVEHEMERNAVKMNRIALGMGILYKGRTTPSVPEAVPASCPVTGVKRDRIKAPEAPRPDPCTRSGNLFFSCHERQERTFDRLNRKIIRLGQRLNTLQGRRMFKRDERRESE